MMCGLIKTRSLTRSVRLILNHIYSCAAIRFCLIRKMNMQSKVIFGLMIPLGFALAAGTWFRWLPRWMWGSRPQETESDKNITKQIKHSGKYENGTNLIARHNLDAELAASSLNRWLSSSDIDWLARGSLGYENHLPAAVIPSSIHMRMTKKAYWYVVQSPDIPSKSLKVDFIESKKQIEIVGSHEDRFESHQEDLLTSLSEESSLEDSFVDMFFRRGMYDFMVDPFISRIKTVSESENKSGPR